MSTFANVLRRAASLLAFVLIPLAGCLATEREETVGVGLTGLDHLAEHLSIQNFWVNGTGGHQAGKGGSTVCCASVPAKWRPGRTVRVRWAVTNWKRRVYGYYERDVPVEVHGEEPGSLYVHFLRDGSVRAIWFDGYPEKRGYPGPAYDTVLQHKQPWDDYARKPGELEFTEVADPMTDEIR
jgi:hypothetical protein